MIYKKGETICDLIIGIQIKVTKTLLYIVNSYLLSGKPLVPQFYNSQKNYNPPDRKGRISSRFVDIAAELISSIMKGALVY